MSPPGAAIMSFFACIFAVLGLMPIVGGPAPVLLAPLLPTLLLWWWAWRAWRRGHCGPAHDPRVGRIVLWSAIGEGIAIFVVIELLATTGWATYMLAAVAGVVGVHFLPMARLIPFRPFYGSAVALLAIAAAAFALPVAAVAPFAGIGAATVLWLAAVVAIRRRAPVEETGA